MITNFYEKNYVQGMIGGWIHVTVFNNANSSYWQEVIQEWGGMLGKYMDADQYEQFIDSLPDDVSARDFANLMEQKYRELDNQNRQRQ